MYFALTVMSTLGFGDIVPTNILERVFVCVVMFIGVTVNSVLLGTMVNVVSEMSASQVPAEILIPRLMPRNGCAVGRPSFGR